MRHFEHLITELDDDGIYTVTLNRPKALNALNTDLLTDLSAVIQEVKTNANIKALLLTGSGDKAFCAGADIHRLVELTPISGLEFAQNGQRLFDALEQLSKPCLAAINGYTFGGGCELAMAAHLRFASEQAIFGLPEVKLGVLPCYGGTQRLSRLIGKGRALDLMLSGANFSAEQALSWGLVTRVVPAADLLSQAKAHLHTIIHRAPLAVSALLTAVRLGYDLSMTEAEAIEAQLFSGLCGTADKAEGVTAFLEKRSATFKGV